MDGAIYETVDAVYSKKSRQKGSNQVRIKNIVTGTVVSKTLHASDTVEEVSLEKKNCVFVYARGDEAVIHPTDKPSERMSVSVKNLAGIALLPSGTRVTALTENDSVLTIQLPIKVDLLVKEAPPNTRGNTAQGGTKRVTVETGATVATPPFIETGERIRVNTETGEYVERAK